jgi:hypothetical protein
MTRNQEDLGAVLILDPQLLEQAFDELDRVVQDGVLVELGAVAPVRQKATQLIEVLLGWIRSG